MTEYNDIRDEDISLAYYVNGSLASDWITVYDAMCKPDHPVNDEALDTFTVFKAELEAGEVKKLVRVEDEYVEQVVTLADVIATIKLNRPYTPEAIKGILMKTHCPLDLHCYADDMGVINAD